MKEYRSNAHFDTNKQAGRGLSQPHCQSAPAGRDTVPASRFHTVTSFLLLHLEPQDEPCGLTEGMFYVTVVNCASYI